MKQNRQAVLIVEDDSALAEALQDMLELAFYEVTLAQDATTALARLNQGHFDLVLSDVHMPGMDGHALLRRIKALYPALPVLLMTAYATVERAVEAIREGAVDYLIKPFEADVLITTVARYAHNASDDTKGVIAEDPRSRELLRLAARVAASEATVMISGESGSGKEVIARYIHDHSPRRDAPFVAINCAAIPENMLEATLFGYERGAFTGAYKTTPGKFEQAQSGTLLLDEISEMALALQAKLLRVLQERELERLGGGKVINLDVRVLATTNREMRAEVAAGRFREDLYYRLNVFPLRLLPLRERPGDIVPLAGAILARVATRTGRSVPTLAPTAAAQLRAYSWPGNVRELDNMMQRALILAEGETIDGDALCFEHISGPGVEPAPVVAAATPAERDSTARDGGEGLSGDLKQREYRLIMEALAAGSRQLAAERLGISPRTLRYKLAQMREAGIELTG
ncbi:MAG: sigma-54 dependent transcriptional regulator [Gammaproteobacteria bacterium]|nr:sigma-54 dependent transcriptional regulator [Gammaproteobacteria bacterium]